MDTHNVHASEVFDTYFTQELNKNPHYTKYLCERNEKYKLLYEMKLKQLEVLIFYLEKIKSIGFYVRTFKDFNQNTSSYSNELLPFDYVVRDTVIKNNFPSPAIFIENPYSIEISIPNIKDDEQNIYFEINPMSSYHPNKDMLKRRYSDIESLSKDLYKFIAKNLYPSNELVLDE